MDVENFDDVDIDSLGSLPHSHGSQGHGSLGYMYKHKRHGITRSSTLLMTNNSYDNVNAGVSGTSKPPLKPQYSPSKKLKRNRELRSSELDHIGNVDNDDHDDELDDSVIIYDVPLSQSLVQLTTHQRMLQGSKNLKLTSLNSQSTNNSSIMSSGVRSDFESDYEVEMNTTMNDNAKKLEYEFSQSESVLASQEYETRRIYITQKMQLTPLSSQGIDDSIPMSAEKMKSLCGTRPSYLPPKASDEALRHSKEVGKLKRQALKLELQLEQKRLKNIKLKDELRSDCLNTWQHEIIPKFDEMVKLSSTRELWWKCGIPQKFRRSIWISSLSHPQQDIAILKQRALKSIKENTSLVEQLEEQITKTFPDLSIFQDELHDQLLLIMLMYYHSTGQITSGLCPLVAILLNTIRTVDEAYNSLCGLLQRHLLKSVYTAPNGNIDFDDECGSFLRTFQKLDPSLSSHFQALGLSPREYLSPMLATMFSNMSSMDICSVIMDVYIFEGDSFLWRCVLTIFDKVAYKLYGDAQEVMDVIGYDALKTLNAKNKDSWMRYLDVGDDIDFLARVRGVLKKSSA